MSWKENVYRNRMLMNSGKLMDGQICVKKKKKVNGIKKKNLTLIVFFST